MKVCTAEINLTSFIGRGVVTESMDLKGDAQAFEFEILLEEGTAESKVGEDSDDDEEESEPAVRIVEILKENPPNADLIK